MSDLRRFFVEEIYDQMVIEGEEFRHAVNVLRVREGEQIIICNNSQTEYLCEIIKISKKDLLVKIVSKRESQAEPKTNVMLIAGYLKGDKTELVVQKAVELGVKEIVVYSSKFSSAFMNENKLARLNKVSVESAKQCGRAIAPKVKYADNFKGALSFAENYKNKLFACEFAEQNQANFYALSGDTAIVVGSEGGFSQEEYDLSKELNFKTVYLGKRILRAETACIALTAIVMSSLNEFK